MVIPILYGMDTYSDESSSHPISYVNSTGCYNGHGLSSRVLYPAFLSENCWCSDKVKQFLFSNSLIPWELSRYKLVVETIIS